MNVADVVFRIEVEDESSVAAIVALSAVLPESADDDVAVALPPSIRYSFAEWVSTRKQAPVLTISFGTGSTKDFQSPSSHVLLRLLMFTVPSASTTT